MTRAWDRRLLDVPRGFDVVHASSLAAPPARNSELVVTVHDMTWRRVPEAFTGRGRRWHEARLRRVISLAAVLVVPSEPVAKDVLTAGASEELVRVIPLGCDHLPPPDFVAAEELLGRLGVGGEFLLSVSTLEPRKNLPRLLDAYERARSRLPDEWPLVLVGPKGWGPGLVPGPGVVLAGPVGDATLAALYRRARLLAYVPLVEGFGFPPLEAMREGAPVVASRVPSAGDAAMGVDPHDVGDIAEALVRVATDEKVRRQLVSAGQARAGGLTWANTARRHVELWASLR
jgi:glycosyltransferase involved in cell wall biosynthesis